MLVSFVLVDVLWILLWALQDDTKHQREFDFFVRILEPGIVVGDVIVVGQYYK